MYKTAETTSLLDYERRPESRHWLPRNLSYALVAAVLVIAVVVVSRHGPTLLGRPSPNIPKDLNFKNSTAPAGCESTILLIRHCDKGGLHSEDEDHDQHCSYVGFERAHFLPTLFGSRWPNPSKLYALTEARKGHKNYREIETLHPLSQKTGLEINSNFSTKQTEELAEHIFGSIRSGEMCGKLTVISWKHSHMPNLAHKLGWKDAPTHYPKSSFDQVWQLKYVYKPPALYEEESEGRRLHPKSDEHKEKHVPEKHAPDKHALDKHEPDKHAPHKHLKGKHAPNKRHKWKHATNKWVVYGDVLYQRFDPLSFSYASGDYPEGGKQTGASWAEDAEDL
jgi:hypothetical protein